jgi:hypothetical protein
MEHKDTLTGLRTPLNRTGGLLAIVALGLAVAASVAAMAPAIQQGSAGPEAMLLQTLQGHRYERVSYDAKGRVEERAVIDVGPLQDDGDSISVSLDVEVQKDGSIARRFSTRWACERRGGDMLMAILVFSEDLDKPSMRFETTGSPLVYPREIPSSGVLPDASVEVKIRQGVLRFFGARTRITFTERRVTPAEAGASRRAYTVTSRIELKAYAWGIRVRRVRFTSEETVDPEAGVLQHILRREDGSYSALRRVTSDAGDWLTRSLAGAPTPAPLAHTRSLTTE